MVFVRSVADVVVIQSESLKMGSISK